MRVYIENIQGFFGAFKFDLGDTITNITAKYNGTGKTTFFDCLKVLANPDSVSKEDLQFLVNHDADVGRFTIRLEDVSYGFSYDRKHLIFLRKYDDGDVECSYTPFPEASRRLGVFVHNGVSVNICDRFINLLSGSDNSFNSNLIESLLLHPQLETFYEFTEGVYSDKKEEVSRLTNDCIYYGNIFKAALHYPGIERFKYLLNQDMFEQAYDRLVKLYNSAESLEYFSSTLSSSIFEKLYCLREQISDICVTDKLEALKDIQSLLLLIGLRDELRVLIDGRDCVGVSEGLENLCALVNELYLLQIPFPTREVNLLTNLLRNLASLEFKGCLDVDYDTIQTLIPLRWNLNEHIGYMQTIDVASSEIKTALSRLEGYAVECPVYKKVFVVGGVCTRV